MGNISVITKTDLPLPLFIRGKVRDTYDLGDYLLIVATDRISAFDVVLPQGIPDKGKVLNQLSVFWFEKTRAIIPNHMEKPVDSIESVKKYLPGKIDTASRHEIPVHDRTQAGADQYRVCGPGLYFGFGMVGV